MIRLTRSGGGLEFINAGLRLYWKRRGSNRDVNCLQISERKMLCTSDGHSESLKYFLSVSLTVCMSVSSFIAFFSFFFSSSHLSLPPPPLVPHSLTFLSIVLFSFTPNRITKTPTFLLILPHFPFSPKLARPSLARRHNDHLLRERYLPNPVSSTFDSSRTDYLSIRLPFFSFSFFMIIFIHQPELFFKRNFKLTPRNRLSAVILVYLLEAPSQNHSDRNHMVVLN